MESTQTIIEFGREIAVRVKHMDGVRITYTLFGSAELIDGMRIYSIRLETRSKYGAEDASAYDISRNRGNAMKLLETLADGIVTSCTLYDVLEELL